MLISGYPVSDCEHCRQAGPDIDPLSAAWHGVCSVVCVRVRVRVCVRVRVRACVFVWPLSRHLVLSSARYW